MHPFVRGLAAAAASAAALPAVAAGIARRRGAFPVRVEGTSMLPTLRPGDQLVVEPVRGPIPYGAVVVARAAGVEMVKRVTKVPGEDGLGPDEYWLAGDNAGASTDSRTIGPVPVAGIAGVVRACYWPPGSWKVFRLPPGASP